MISLAEVVEQQVDELQRYIVESIMEGGTQADVAGVYAQGIAANDPDTNWKEINAIIMTRWSRSGLTRVKEMAWKLVEET